MGLDDASLQHSLESAIATPRILVLLENRVSHALFAAASTALHVLYRRFNVERRAEHPLNLYDSYAFVLSPKFG